MTSLLVTCKALGQSPLQPDQYRSSIKIPCFIVFGGFILNYDLIMIQAHNFTTYNDYSQITTTITTTNVLLQRFNEKLHFVNWYCFCNTELRTATVTKIKGFSIQTQQNTFVLFTLFKLTLDERKTLTKISTRIPLTTIPQTSAGFRHEGTRKPANCRETSQKYRAQSGGRKPVKSILHN